MWKCFLQFTAVAIFMKFKLEEPPCTLSPGAKPHSVETLVLLGLTPRSGWISGVSQPPDWAARTTHQQREPKTLKCGTDTYTGNLILCYKIICITSNSFKGFFFPLFFKNKLCIITL